MCIRDSPRRVQTLQTMLTTKGKIVKDGWGCHNNRPNKIPEESVDKIHEHIQSLKGRRSHYSRHDSKTIYLDDTLNIKKLHNQYLKAYPNKPTSYDSYRNIINTKYNIGFGYPRTDTCSSCDEYIAWGKDLKLQKSPEVEAICMDYPKNLCAPNISTNKVYYKRQLSYYLFNIHTLFTCLLYTSRCV